MIFSTVNEMKNRLKIIRLNGVNFDPFSGPFSGRFSATVTRAIRCHSPFFLQSLRVRCDRCYSAEQIPVCRGNSFRCFRGEKKQPL